MIIKGFVKINNYKVIWNGFPESLFGKGLMVTVSPPFRLFTITAVYKVRFSNTQDTIMNKFSMLR